jgi:hypothetical protein
MRHDPGKIGLVAVASLGRGNEGLVQRMIGGDGDRVAGDDRADAARTEKPAAPIPERNRLRVSCESYASGSAA